MLQWNPKLVALVVVLVLIAALAAFGAIGFGGGDFESFSW